MATTLNSTRLTGLSRAAATSIADGHWQRALQIAADLGDLDKEPVVSADTALVSGVVSATAADALPIEGAQVALRTSHGRPLNIPCTTDADGSFELIIPLDVEGIEDALRLTVKHP